MENCTYDKVLDVLFLPSIRSCNDPKVPEYTNFKALLIARFAPSPVLYSNYHRGVASLDQSEVHQQPASSAIAIHKGVNVDQPSRGSC